MWTSPSAGDSLTHRNPVESVCSSPPEAGSDDADLSLFGAASALMSFRASVVRWTSLEGSCRTRQSLPGTGATKDEGCGSNGTDCCMS